MSIMAFIVLEAFSILALSCISLFFYYYKKNKILFKFSSLIFFDLLKKGLPLMISAGAIVVYGKIDIVLIKHFLDIEMVGIYSVAIKISELWYVVPMSISAILFPLIVNAKNHSENKYLNQVFITSQVMIVVCSLFALILFFLVSNFIEHYLSDEYIGVGPLIKVFALCGPFVGLGYINGGCMVAENLLLFSMKRNIYGMLINIVLNIILIPLYGLYGAAISTLIAVIYTSMISLAFNKKAYKILCTQIRAFFYAANILKFIDNIILIEKSHKKL
jgi:O-antigen/teichoic acid export membrane protein